MKGVTSLARDFALIDYEVYRASLLLEAEQLRAEGRMPLTYRVVLNQAEIARRAYVIELTDPEPIERPWHDCAECSHYLSRSAR